MRWHVLIPLLRAATSSSPHISSTGSKNRFFYFARPHAQKFNRQWIDDEVHCPGTHRCAPGGSHPSRPRLGHRTPSFSIEKHFVLPPSLYISCSILPRRSLSYQYIQMLSSTVPATS